MGKFKEFIINEQEGFGQLGTNIDKLFKNQWLDTAINGAFLTSDVNGTDQSPPFNYSGSYPDKGIDLTIPSVQKSGRITTLMTKRNPIYIRLSDGTEANFTYDEYKRIEGSPALGKTMTIIFQRHPEDCTDQHSKIDKVIVRD